MRAAHAVLPLLLLLAAGCSSTTTRSEIRKIETELKTQPSQADDADVLETEEVMEPESDPDDR
jgi:hypothetical protein